ncbi:hypothetical protein, partial [Streptomyces phaeochromogenes]|uniref:hypothetical protein n=1 Tax=Streptomyces phaeochromogenes TaxID=1923 RepID=UPI003F4D22D4
MTSTRPSFSRVAECPYRAVPIGAATGVQVPAAGSKTSAEARTHEPLVGVVRVPRRVGHGRRLLLDHVG